MDRLFELVIVGLFILCGITSLGMGVAILAMAYFIIKKGIGG